MVWVSVILSILHEVLIKHATTPCTDNLIGDFINKTFIYTRQKNDQVALMKTGLNNALFTVVNNIEQYCTILLHLIQAQQYCSILLTSMNNVGSKTLFNPVKQRAQRF
jgi:hypothetical protein